MAVKGIDKIQSPLISKVDKLLRKEIVDQGFKRGEKIPSVAQWASRLSVSDRTIQHALKNLKDQGILSSHVGKGTFLEKMPLSDEGQTKKKESFTNTIAILDGQSEVDIICEHTESWTTRIVHGIRVEAAAQKIDLLLLNESFKMDTLINRLSNIKKKVDGVITFPFTDSYTMFEIFDKCNIPVLTINRSCSESKYNYVAADYFEGSKLVGTLFSEIKCKKIWFISTQVSGVFSKEQRYKGLLEGLQMSGCDADVKVMVADTATDSEGYDIVKRALAEETPPDGIYCSGDYLALGAMNALKEKSISVGKQKGTSVVGSSGFELSANSQPPLSVVQIPMIEMGRKAIRKMLSLRETPDRREAGAMLPTELILRESTPKYLCEQGWLDKILNNYTQAHL